MKDPTKIVSGGRHPQDHAGAVNPPAYRASTITYPTLAEWDVARHDRFNKVLYGRFGTPQTKAFEEAMAVLEGGERAVATSSGLAAGAAVVMANVKAGAHVLLPDTVYGPIRNLCTKFLVNLGVETTFYDPMIGAGIDALIRPETSLIYLESPGSQTFEVQDVPAIVAVAKDRGIPTAMDNTWATPVLFKPLAFGVDYSINAATKYIVGHSDAMLGVVTTREELFEPLKIVANGVGNCAGSEELYLGLRGLRTLDVRLERHGRNALQLAQWFDARPEIDRVLYPALPSCPGHEYWKRDFNGASGLFTVIFGRDYPRNALAAMIDGLEHFMLGASFGGYESLVLPINPAEFRTNAAWETPGPCIRFHVGLEDPGDLIADLESGFERLNAAA